MDRKFCDKCGKEICFENSPSFFKCNIREVFLGKLVSGGIHDGEIEIDLCKDCYKEFKEEK